MQIFLFHRNIKIETEFLNVYKCSGKMALVLAVISNHKEVVDFLIQKGAKTKPLRAIERKKISAAMLKWLKAKKSIVTLGNNENQ